MIGGLSTGRMDDSMSEPVSPTSATPPRTPTPFSFRQLECFLAIAEKGSISAAATSLHASGSAVSEALTSLEEALGATLFVRRRSKGATLTSDGRVVLRIARTVIAGAELLTGSVGDRLHSLTGPVRVGFTGTLANHLLPALIVAVQEEHPNVFVEHMIGDMPSLLEAHEAGELDLVVTYDLDFIPEYSKRRLMTTEMMVLLASGHPLAQSAALSLEELEAHPMVLLDIAVSRLHTFDVMRRRGVSPRIAYRTDDRELHRSLIQRGLGYGIQLNLDSLPLPVERDGVVYLPITPPAPSLAVLVAWRWDPLPPRVRAIVEIMERVVDASQGQPMNE
jgi:DNA-binding transcriptional LysR family regulator